MKYTFLTLAHRIYINILYGTKLRILRDTIFSFTSLQTSTCRSINLPAYSKHRSEGTFDRWSGGKSGDTSHRYNNSMSVCPALLAIKHHTLNLLQGCRSRRSFINSTSIQTRYIPLASSTASSAASSTVTNRRA